MKCKKMKNKTNKSVELKMEKFRVKKHRKLLFSLHNREKSVDWQRVTQLLWGSVVLVGI